MFQATVAPASLFTNAKTHLWHKTLHNFGEIRHVATGKARIDNLIRTQKTPENSSLGIGVWWSVESFSGRLRKIIFNILQRELYLTSWSEREHCRLGFRSSHFYLRSRGTNFDKQRCQRQHLKRWAETCEAPEECRNNRSKSGNSIDQNLQKKIAEWDVNGLTAESCSHFYFISKFGPNKTNCF